MTRDSPPPPPKSLLLILVSKRMNYVKSLLSTRELTTCSIPDVIRNTKMPTTPFHRNEILTARPNVRGVYYNRFYRKIKKILKEYSKNKPTRKILDNPFARVLRGRRFDYGVK